MEAIADIHDSTTRDIIGQVYFRQLKFDPPTMWVEVEVEGIYPANSYHGIHIHAYGDTSRGCHSMGPHFSIDPDATHGSRSGWPRHTGDLGSIWSNQDGRVHEAFEVEGLVNVGNTGIVGRGIVIHEDEDDLGMGGNEESLKTGNSGDRIACGVIRPISL